MNEIRIIGLLIHDRIKEAGKTQGILTKYSHLIKSRMGFHELSEAVCSRHGVIILNVSGELKECEALETELSQLGGVELKNMVFELSKY